MNKTLLALSIISLAACTPVTPGTETDSESSHPNCASGAIVEFGKSSEPIAFVEFTDESFGISLELPASYVVQEPLTESPNTMSGSSFDAEFIYMRDPQQGESPFIQISRTQDPVILTGYLNADHPLEEVTINGTTWQRFHWEGMGDPFGYVIRQGDWYYVVAFTGWDETYAKEKVMSTVEFDS